MRTSDPDIFAVGDAVEVKDFVTGEWSLIPLAGPANRQGRIVAEVIAGEMPVFAAPRARRSARCSRA
jgi:NADPH-dependent 2,4-dienoyl-CoA reductase/sulfur reductase-like enzyme